ncbi:MAG: hypothetical protein A2099_05665 [Planctomycetes bacterium GWF2_39_10]|nr:MAG: hypothetical protein A2Y09_06700 [Planctomycetes bacterium GWA2_39_15]OHB47417.1 MAG: hypothetical protein A2099_05665 [Planctomycetes bacterium GWF2_39_10]
MYYRKLGKTGLNASVIGFGCNQIGSGKTGYKDFARAKEALFLALDKGINYFDTADVYGERLSEEWLGRILGSERAKVIISTKAGLTGDGGRNGHPDHLRNSLENSLKKLKTDYVDMFYLHRPDPKIPLAESIGGINNLIREGKARFGGVSQLSLEELRTVKNDTAVSCVQYCLNFFDFQTTYSIRSETSAMHYGFSTFSPLASGWILKTKYTALAKSKFPFFQPGYYRPEFPAYKLVIQLAQEHQIGIHQLAIHWVLNHQEVHSVICGTSSCDQLQENIKALDLSVTSDLIEKINDIVQKYTVEGHKMRKIVWGIGTKMKKVLH